MKAGASEHFTPLELYLLLAPFETEHLFGVPDKIVYTMQEEDAFEEAMTKLKAKGILTENGELTTGGIFLIDSLQAYQESEHYVRLNQFLFAFPEDKEES